MLNLCPNFLIVDDDGVTCKLVEKLVRYIYPDSNIKSYTETLPALESLMKYKYDICILDFNIDEMNGREFLDEALKLQKIEGAIMMTDMKSQDFILETLREGFNDFIVKPIEKKLFQDTISRVWKEITLKREIHKNYKKYVDMMSSLPDIVYKIDDKLIISYVNHAISVLGYSPKEIIGQHISAIIHHDDIEVHTRDYAISHLDKVECGKNGHPKLLDERRTGERLTRNLSVRLVSKKCKASKDPHSYFATGDINSSGFKDEQGISSIGVIRDITTYQQTLCDLEEKKIIATNALKAKGDFLSNMSHEIRTPMNGILAASNLILQNNPSEENRELAELIFHSTKSLIDIINDILCFSKLEAGGISIKEDYVNLERLIKDIYDLFIYQIDSKEVELIIPKFPLKHNYLLGDPVRIRQILMNLIGNAYKFTKSGSINIQVDIKEKELPNLDVSFSIKDTGIGIPSHKLDEIFSRYTQVDSELNRVHEGTGLGLAISEKLVNLMNGEIGVQSKVGEGTEFKFTLPLKVSEKLPEEESRDVEMKSYPDKKVLVVDDNKINLKVMSKILDRFEVKADLVESGEEAIRLCKDEAYDIILMDVQMPGIDGVEATRQILAKDESKNQLILALTANVLEETKRSCLKVGMKKVLFKPICLDDIKIAFDEFLS